jgi:hypothetical protein
MSGRGAPQFQCGLFDFISLLVRVRRLLNSEGGASGTKTEGVA